MGDLKVLKCLIKIEANVNATNRVHWTALHYASYKGHVEHMRVLLEAQADPNLRENTDGWTSLHWAVQYGYLANVKILVENKADLNLRTYSERMTPLKFAKSQKKWHILDYLKQH